MEFSKLESGLYLLIANILGSEESLQGYEFPEGYRSGSLLVGDELDPIYAVFSFPKNTNDCYIMITDGEPKELAKQMAALQRYNESEAHLCRWHTIPTESPYLNNAGWYSYLIATPKFSYDEFPDSHIIDGREIMLHLAMPLSKYERQLKIELGIDALIDSFEAINRDSITFDQSHNKSLHPNNR